MKRAISFILTVGILLSCALTLGSISVFAETGYDRGYDRTMGGTGAVSASGDKGCGASVGIATALVVAIGAGGVLIATEKRKRR